MSDVSMQDHFFLNIQYFIYSLTEMAGFGSTNESHGHGGTQQEAIADRRLHNHSRSRDVAYSRLSGMLQHLSSTEQAEAYQRGHLFQAPHTVLPYQSRLVP